ncbi:pilus assembly PilX family protein [Endozoicomonas euniceicola]|uniref:PilX N-terminal domain-containing pilus assembly protein n=1 Tax=Endozoicomonas euniceicola TaxID=1234143 RepID=A0ABY6GTD5_9GAMM|nr:PilX N-terminal domain-containing pilus assembly protein [Endozoicomonas euniceicola]UYM15313.1 PilX N-terminal domain-containing pilus assembly protein [Endozoicomonas euniceicola]
MIQSEKEQGSVLLVSLVLLLILTVAGMASIRVTSLEEKMTGNYRNEQLAFHSAEVGVLEAESYVANTLLNSSDFSANCDNGLCFDGTAHAEPGTCSATVSSPWEEQALWSNTGRYRTTTVVLNGVATQAKYIVEFRCYLPREIDGPDADPTVYDNWAEFYRITVLATGGSGDARVMLQTTYKKNR